MASSRPWSSLAWLAISSASLWAQADRFEAFLWRHGGPPLSAAFAAAVRRAGLTGICVDQNEDPQQATRLGLRFYLDHAAGKGVLHLRKADFDRCFHAYESSRSAEDLQRPMPLMSGRVRRSLLELVETRVGRAAEHGPHMISLDDEISITRNVNPLDFCFAPSTLQAFRTWLQARYGTIEALNRAWNARFADFDSVAPPTTDAVRKRELVQEWPRRLTDWSDHREFMDVVLQETLAVLARRSRALAPGVPVGFEGGQAPAAFGGFDWQRLLQEVSFVEPYDQGGTRELVRSLKKPGTLHFETVFPEKNPIFGLRSVARLYDAAAHGLSGVIVWSAGEFFGGTDPESLAGYGQLLARELPRLTGDRGRVLAGARVHDGVIWILESQASVRLHWMLDAAGDGNTWIRRFTSYESTHSTSRSARLSWIRLLQDLGYAFRFVTEKELLAAGGRRPRAVILPSCLALSDPAVASLARLVEAGALLVADESPARYNERLQQRIRPAFDSLFGVARTSDRRFLREGRARSDAPRAATGLTLAETGLEPEGITVARRVGEPASRERSDKNALIEVPVAGTGRGHWCQFERTVGEGRAALLNLAVCEYARARLEASKAPLCRDLRSRVRRLFDRHGLRETVLARVRGYPTVLERILLSKGDKRVLVVRANCLEKPELFTELVARGSQPMTLVLPFAAKVRDLWSGKLVGSGRRIEAKLDPLRGSFFLLEAF